MKPQASRRLRQFDPAAAAAIRFRVGEMPDRVQSKSSHESHMHPWCRLVVEAIPHHAFSQNVQRLQFPHLSPVGHDSRLFDPGKIANLNLVGRRLREDRPGKTNARQLFVKERREQKKFPMPKSKALASFRQAAFADDHALPSRAQRSTDEGPFLETDALHFAPRKLRSRACPSRSTCTRIRSFRGTASQVPRRISPRPRRKACMASLLPITTPMTA